MVKAGQYLTVFVIGCFGYSLIELLWRGYTHWTMALTGGGCLVFIYITQYIYKNAPLWKKCLAGSLFITLSELAVGFLVNIVLRWDVWDYSDRFMNLFGQICVLYSFLWFLLCIPAVHLCAALERVLARTKNSERTA